MVGKQEYISLDKLLIHPGETIEEIIKERNISQKELAIRTGFSEKHISTIINGQKDISAKLALRLEYALDVPSSFWSNLQINYDLQRETFNELHEISEDEKRIAKEVKSSINLLTQQEISSNGPELVYQIRQLLRISKLTDIAKLSVAQYRTQFIENTSENIMYIWQYLCENKTIGQTNNPLNVEKLKSKLNDIKKIMHRDFSEHINLIQKFLNECGILFTVEKHVKKAPIKGLTVKTKTGQVMIALTIRGKYVDIFWFTLFHEISHVINGDYLKNEDVWKRDKQLEKHADEFANNILIDKKEYDQFVAKRDFSLLAINVFALDNDVLPTIVIGRLMNDKKIPWNFGNRLLYSWADEL